MKTLNKILILSILLVNCVLAKETYLGPAPDGPMRNAEVDFSAFSATYSTQVMSQWCWAASISNIFSFYGHPVSQDRIVASVYGLTWSGTPPNLPAMSGATIARQVNRVWVDDNGNKFRASLVGVFDCDAGVNSMNNNAIINELRRDRPLLVCNSHHCMVMTAFVYTPARVVNIGVFDPWPTSGGARGLSLSEATPAFLPGGELRFIAAVRVTDIAHSIRRQ